MSKRLYEDRALGERQNVVRFVADRLPFRHIHEAELRRVVAEKRGDHIVGHDAVRWSLQRQIAKQVPVAEPVVGFTHRRRSHHDLGLYRGLRVVGTATGAEGHQR